VGRVAFASLALAQDEPADVFNGFRLEAITVLENTGVDFDDDFHDGGKQSQTGWLYGVAAGHDFRIGRMPSPTRRCAIYTRKSSEEGLDQ
jgi:hypothetical protein